MGIAALLAILQAINVSSPLIGSLIAQIKGGQAAGKTDDEIWAEAMALAQETKRITEEDMTDKP